MSLVCLFQCVDLLNVRELLWVVYLLVFGFEISHWHVCEATVGSGP